ncbi:Peptide hydrolase [Colletotrichum higginsianum IMI 349063]|uniref:Peptide hydrolase n=3 Tax=Colletotrichum higginsianum TaxID=80884 RepID=A0A1B7YSY6_COLHI|nr:Peptide hydrolase [Colletotrichum higginsianum IMI 349063]OBR15146.1 Peptide hydrolase [Colletotrichum higginsianum IMI 349063]TID04977.1 Leucine aminopeptidase 1 [Colletotrichum higginsianum]
MHLNAALAILAASRVALAAPAADEVKVNPALRLIKTSEADAGVWVTEEQKIENYVNKHIGFFDITDITDEEVLAVLSTPPEAALEARQAVTYPTTLSHVSEANTLIARVSNTQPQSWLKTLTDFYNRYYLSTYGTQSATWLFNQVKSVAAVNSAITVTQFTHSWNQPSIIAKIPGTSSDLVIVGAHFDSTGGSSTARGPGADDNGSGVVVILEALRVLANAGFKPKNTLEFHFYAAEEAGLRGSSAIFSNYKAAGKRVLGFVNQDMAGYSPSGRVSVYNDYVDTALSNYVRLVATQYTGLAPTSDTCGYGCSDHAAARSNGFPAAYVCDEPIRTSTPYIHTPNDSYDTIQWPAILRHSKFTVGFLVEASYL